MKDINIYIIQRFYDNYINFLNNYNLENIIFKNKKVNINFINKFNIDKLKNYDIIIKFQPNYSKDALNIMLKNIVFINTFLKYEILENKNTLVNNVKLFPYSFYMYNIDKDIINDKINEYNKFYDNNLINKDFGKDLWIVKENYSNRGIGTFICNTSELYKINKQDIVIQKYLENTYTINKKKIDIRVHLFIIPKVKFINGKYQLYYKNNKLVLNYYLHNLMLYKYTHNDYDVNDKDIKTHLTNNFVQNGKNYFFLENQSHKQNIKNNIKYKLISYIFNKNTQDNIYKCIDNYNYFYQIIGIDLIVTNNNESYIVDINTKPGLHNNEFDNTYLLISFLQRVFRTIYKLKYNKKYNINKNIKNYLEKLFNIY